MEQYIDTLPNYMVLVRCYTFNHSAYISDALNGFTMQHTNFPYVVVMVDDASNDGEQEVIKEYIGLNFEIPIFTKDTDYAQIIYTQHKTNKNCYIAIYFLKENHYSKKKKKAPYIQPWRNKCKYEALCEGDDYWIDSLKLQKQVSFLEKSPSYCLCFHSVKTIYEQGCEGKDIFTHVKVGEYSLDYILRKWTVPTCSMVLKTDIYKYIPINPNFKYGDNVLLLTCFGRGKVFCIDGILGVYRRNLGGWTMNKSKLQLFKEQYIHLDALIESFPNLTLDYLKKKKASFAAYLHVYDKDLSTELKKGIRKDYKLYPFLFMLHYIKYNFKKLLRRK